MLISLLIFLQKASEFATSSEGREYAPPSGPIYYIILIASSAIVLLTIILAIKWFFWPGEQSEDHIKRKIINSEPNKLHNDG